MARTRTPEQRRRAVERAMAWVAAHREHVREYQRKYREKHREHLAAEKKAWGKAHTRVYDAARRRQCYMKYRDKELTKHREWTSRNRLYVIAYRKGNRARDQDIQNKYYRKYPEKNQARTNRRRARLKLVGTESFSPLDITTHVGGFGRKCVYCGGEYQHLDHIIPISIGGPHALWNLVPCCRSCNSAKRAKHPSEWMFYGLEHGLIEPNESAISFIREAVQRFAA